MIRNGLKVEDLPKLTAALLDLVASGALTTGEASALSTLAANHSKILELAELEKRISALENKGDKNGGNSHE